MSDNVFDPTPDKRYTDWMARELIGPRAKESFKFYLTVWMYLESAQQFESIERYDSAQVVIRIQDFFARRLGQDYVRTDEIDLIEFAKNYYTSFIDRYISTKIPKKYMDWIYQAGLYSGVSFDEVENLVQTWEKTRPNEDIYAYNINEVRKMINKQSCGIVEGIERLLESEEEERQDMSEERLQEIAKGLGIELEEDAIEQMLMGMEVELEHGTKLGDIVNVTDDDETKTFQIALAHVMEIPDYYTRLAAMEEEGKAYWAEQEGVDSEEKSEEESETEDSEGDENLEESKEEKKWKAPEGILKKDTNEIVSLVIEDAKDLDQVMTRLSSLGSEDMGTKELGKINRVRNIVKHTFGESKELTETVRAKFESGVYYFQVKCKTEEEFKSIQKLLSKASGIQIHSTYPPQNMIKVKVESPTAKNARSLVRDVVQKFNGVTVESRIRRNF